MLELRGILTDGYVTGHYTAEVDGAVVANVKWVPFWATLPAEIVIQGERLETKWKGRLITLETGGSVLAEMRRESLWRSKYSLIHRSQRYKIQPEKSWSWSANYLVSNADDCVVGNVKPRDGFGVVAAKAELPDNWPVAIQVFLTWALLAMKTFQESFSDGVG